MGAVGSCRTKRAQRPDTDHAQRFYPFDHQRLLVVTQCAWQEIHVDGGMWFQMEKTQETYHLLDGLFRAIGKEKLQDKEELINSLIERGADINCRHYNGTLLPLHHACCLGDWRVVQLLIQRGAKVNEVDGYNRTALHYAAEHDDQCVRILIESGAQTNHGDGNGNTALHWAAYINNTACVRTLLQLEADVNTVDFNNDTPISFAARKGHLDVIRVLLDYNADVDIRNNFGQTALEKSFAVQASGLNTMEDDACAELFIKASGQFNLSNFKGELFPVMDGDNRLNEMVQPLVSTPRSLLEQCRKCVRHSLGRKYLPQVVPDLPVPTKLHEFLLLRNKNSVVHFPHLQARR